LFQVGDHHFAGASSNRISSLAFEVEGRIPGEREIIRQHMIGLHDPCYADMDAEKIALLQSHGQNRPLQRALADPC